MKTYPIRLKIFETNSSSSHSFSLGPRGRLANTIKISEEGIINVSTNLWEGYDKFNDPLLKLSYLLCFAYTLTQESDYNSLINKISEVVKNFTGASEVKVDIDDFTLIDHQSLDIIDIRDLRDPEFIKEFVFNPSTWVYAIWDSCDPEEGFYEETEEKPILYFLKFDLPGIEEEVIIPIRYGNSKEDIIMLIFDCLSQYYWSGEKFYKEKIHDWFVPYSGNFKFGEKRVDFSIILPNNDNN